MRLSFRGRPVSRRRKRRPLATGYSTSLLALSSLVASAAIQFTEVPSSNLDLVNLGQVGIAGDFSGISLFQFEGQTETPVNINGSESLLAQLPNGQFIPIVSTDASIMAMCQVVRRSGSTEGVLIGGNFTSLNGQESHGIALFNPNTTEITPLEGLSGQVNALLCDQETDKVYVGGNLRTATSTNAVAWNSDDGWLDLGFAGFNGPVLSITKTSSGRMVFGGSFTGLGNTSFVSNDALQIINLATADISGGLSSTRTGFSDPRNIICNADIGSEGPGSTWLMQDQSRGFWSAKFKFGFQPTKIRLYNTRFEGRGTKTWRFTVIPDNGIMNFTYVDPATGQNRSCTSECPLSDSPNVAFQDFFFVNRVGMDEFRIDVSDFYGQGAGFNGIQLFDEDVFVYAVNDFNSALCAGADGGSSATVTGPWETSPSFLTNSEYLTTSLSGTIDENSASVIFRPNLKQSGFYSVNMYTPGCLQDNTCATRGQVSITINAASDQAPTVTSIYQTNSFPKYDQVYFGFMEAGTFQPSVAMTPLPGQGLNEMTFVAQRVGFRAINSTGGLNGLFEFDPNDTDIGAEDFTDSEFDNLSAGFSSGSAVNALASSGEITYIGGNFTSDSIQNIIAVNNDVIQDLDGGLNGAVNGMYLNGTQLYLGGDFTSTRGDSDNLLQHAALFNADENSFSPLGAGLDCCVMTVVAVKLNVGDETQDVAIAFTGTFSRINAFPGNPEASVPGFAVWVPSRANWLSNLSGNVPGLSGVLSSSILNLPEGDSLLGGSVASSDINANGAASLSRNGDIVLTGFPVRLRQPGSNGIVSKRDVSLATEVNGVVTGAFYTNNGNNIAILAGHFDAQASDESTIHNLIFIDRGNDNEVTGIDSSISQDSTFVAVGISGDTLLAGGKISGTSGDENASGVISYNLADMSLNSIPSLTGANATVSAIAVRPDTNEVYVGGSFGSAGELSCPGVCFYDTDSRRWNRPGVNLQGFSRCLMWSGDNIPSRWWLHDYQRVGFGIPCQI